MREQRRLAAILVADVVGYSKLVGRDEAGTLVQLRALRSSVIEPAIGKHAGRLFKAVGDGFLVEFASAVQAVEAAQAIQQANAEGALPLRIGIHVGDVVVQGEDLMGDGVNIAARIEGVAHAGGIAISRAVHEQVRDKLDVGFEDKGEIALKNLARPVHVFSIAGSKPAAAPAPALALPDKPSIAVLPFQNMSGDAEQEYFTDGITEDITAALSRIPSLFVIARNSSFAYKGKAIDVYQISRELGVRYLLEGSVRKAGSRLRITGQLIEAETRAHLWADKFDSVLEDVFDLQDRVTMAVAGAIEPSVTQAEIKRANRKPTESLQAYDWLLRARGEQQLFSRDGFDRAMAMGRRAIELDPRYAQAYGSLANWTTFRKFLGWMEDEEAETAKGVRFAQLAVQLAPNDSIVLTEAGLAVGNLIRDLASAIPWLDRAITLNPNSAHAYGRGAHVRNFVGDYAAAIGLGDRLDASFLDMGAQALKNIARPIPVWRWSSDGIPATSASPPVLALPDKPSLAVLPFDNMSGDPEQAYFADGLAEDLITGLSRFSWLFVIARNSSFAFRGEKLDVRTIGERLGVRYLVEGSVRRAGERLRLTAQLIEAATGNHLWADRYDGSLGDVFDFQDRIVTSLVGTIEPKLRATEVARARHKRPDSLDAFDLYLQALPKVGANSVQSIAEAIKLLDRAIGLSPDYAQALVTAALCRALRPLSGSSPDVDRDFREADELSRRALDGDPTDSMTLSLAGLIAALVRRDYQTGWDLIDRSLAINPNDARAWRNRGWVSAWAGETETALAEFENAMRLSPLDPYAHRHGISAALYWGGRPEEALPWARRALQEHPGSSTVQDVLIASLWLSGRHAEAREAARRYVEMFPGISLRRARVISPLRGTSGQQRFRDALREAGLPE